MALRAVSRKGRKLEFVSKKLQNDKDVVLVACSQDSWALQYASDELQNDKEVVLVACSQDGLVLKYASDELKNDKDFMLDACSQDGRLLRFASEELKDHKEVVLAACSQHGDALQYASKEIRNDKEVVLRALAHQNPYGSPLQYASEALKNNKEVILAACSEYAEALLFASEELQKDKEVVIAACSKDGDLLKFASEPFRADKDVVIAAVKSKPESLKYALGGLNQDKDCLTKAGLWDENYIKEDDGGYSCLTNQKRKIVLSTKFSLAAESSPHATRFALELKKHPYIMNGGFVVYSPNAFNKGTCDPNWTDKNWPCRGTYNSCQKAPHLKSGVPQEFECCWRYSFRYQLEEARRSGGFMIQVVDGWDGSTWGHKLGDGQKIETEMAQDVGIKIFRYFEPHRSNVKVRALVSKIDEWYKKGSKSMCECNVKQSMVQTSLTIHRMPLLGVRIVFLS